MPRSAAPDEPIDVAAASGGLMMVRRADFLDLGGFYEPIFMYGEEADYCLRAPRKGRPPSRRAPSRHESGHASGPHQSPLRLYWSSRNRLLNAARHLSAPGARRLGARFRRVRRGDACPGPKPPGAGRDRQGLARRTAPDGRRATGPAAGGAPRGDPAARVVPGGLRRAAAARPARVGATSSESHVTCPACGAAAPRRAFAPRARPAVRDAGRLRGLRVLRVRHGRTMPARRHGGSRRALPGHV